ncbi:MAG TPA: hypothetical protein VEY51_16800, partial [Chondromyces sp.]|nr:hypothetical protein [Chondromyces sp.]
MRTQYQAGYVPGLGLGAAAGAGTVAGATIKNTGKTVSAGTSKSLTQGTGATVNLVSPQRTQHILYADKTGGGHLCPGKPGKSTFPQLWDANKVMEYISDIATDPKLIGQPGRIVNGMQ